MYPLPYLSEEKKQVLLSYADSLVAQGTATPVPTDKRFQGVYTPLFIVLKKNDSLRPVIDLTHLNSFIKKEKFKMETLLTICQAIQPGDWLMFIDLKDAYFHVPIAEEFHKFLSFAVYQVYLQFTCLLFGLTTSPCVFLWH